MASKIELIGIVNGILSCFHATIGGEVLAERRDVVLHPATVGSVVLDTDDSISDGL